MSRLPVIIVDNYIRISLHTFIGVCVTSEAAIFLLVDDTGMTIWSLFFYLAQLVELTV